MLKISGESLAGSNEQGFDFEILNDLALSIKKLQSKNLKISIVLGGGNFTYNMSNSDELTQNENISFKKINYSLDVGFGVDIYFAYFKFSPEIKYSYGLRNLLIQQKNEYSNVLSGITTRGLLISLTFE